MFWVCFLGVLVGVHVSQGRIKARNEALQALRTAQVC